LRKNSQEVSLAEERGIVRDRLYSFNAYFNANQKTAIVINPMAKARPMMSIFSMFASFSEKANVH
jgi:hypothetical protein